jgi:hypothetical protein
MPAMVRIALLMSFAMMASACATRYTIKSFPEGATVFVKDIVTQEKKLVGQTPLTLKKTKDMGEVFFLNIEKDSFFPKQVLMTPKEGENLTVTVTLDPVQDSKTAGAEKGGDGKDNQNGQQGNNPQDQKKKEEEAKKKSEDALKDMTLRIALLENTVSMYKDALFSGRYASSGGPARFDRDRNDQIVDHLFKSQQLVMLKKYNEALSELDKALLMDEYLPQAHMIKGTIFYVNKQFDQAKLAWERCLKIDPYNAQAYQYLRLVNKKLGAAMPPDRPSMLRAPASEEFAKDLRDISSLKQ